jgi:dihydrofolate reductase
MRKVIAAINITLDGFCDHTAGVPDAEIHNHYTGLLKSAGDLLYGRTTYQMMEEYWPTLVKKPSGEKSMDDFAQAIQQVSKVVFSHTLKEVTWENSRLAKKDLEEEVLSLKKQPGKDIFAGSPSIISALNHLKLIDEYQLCIHPVIIGGGLPLFKNVSEMITLKLVKTKTFMSSGAVLHYYRPA